MSAFGRIPTDGMGVQATGMLTFGAVAGIVCRAYIDPNPTFVDSLESSLISQFEQRMKQKLSDLASIAEIIASVAVVATLIVLIFGVRENTEVVRASAYASNVENINNLQIGMLNDPDAVRVWTDFMSGEAADLDRIDTMRLNLMLLTLFRSYESAYFNRSYGVLGEEESNRFDRSICEFFALARSADRTRPLRNTLTEGFFAYMIELCSD